MGIWIYVNEGERFSFSRIHLLKQSAVKLAQAQPTILTCFIMQFCHLQFYNYLLTVWTKEKWSECVCVCFDWWQLASDKRPSLYVTRALRDTLRKCDDFNERPRDFAVSTFNLNVPFTARARARACNMHASRVFSNSPSLFLREWDTAAPPTRVKVCSFQLH